MKINYIQPKTEVIATITQMPLADSGGKDANAKQNIYIIDIDEESSDYRNIPWPQPKSLWDD